MADAGAGAFAPGKHAFRITAKGCREAHCEVEVVADKLVQADVQMRRQ